MNRKQFLYDHRMDDEEEEKQPKSDLMMFSKKLEKYFFDKGPFISGVWWMIKAPRMW